MGAKREGVGLITLGQQKGPPLSCFFRMPHAIQPLCVCLSGDASCDSLIMCLFFGDASCDSLIMSFCFRTPHAIHSFSHFAMAI